MTEAHGKLSKPLLRSFIFHIAIVGVFAIKAFLIPSESIDISNAVRVDIIDLPDKIDQRTSPAPATNQQSEPVTETKTVVETKPEKKPEPVINLSRKQKQTDALKRIKAMQALDKIEESVREEEASARTAQYKGNVISAGTELKGLQKSQFDAYLVQLNQHIKENWQLPEWMARQDFKAQALVLADSRGVIVKRSLIKSSGNKTFDDYVLDAIDRSNPLPTPPGKFSSILEHQGVILAFPD